MKSRILIYIALVLSLLQSCGGGNTNAIHKGDKIEMRHARNIKMREISPGVTLADLRNPWDTTATLARYALVEKGVEIPSGLPTDTKIIRVPLESSVVFSGVHVSLLDELGAGKAVVGVCDAEYINDTTIRDGLTKGRIADCGQSMQPNIERIVSLHPGAVLLSPYDNADPTQIFAKTGINVIQTADYMEATPLGRAEWMRFYGRLFGKSTEADSLFSSIEKNYESIRQRTEKTEKKPKVLFDRIYSGVWDVPTSGSVTGHLIADAGGTNPFDEYKQGGSAHLSSEEVILKGHDADVWVIRYLEPSLTLTSLGRDNASYMRFKAYRNKNIYGANTLTVPLFEDGAFHPDKILKEMLRILHPELEKTPLEYYQKLSS